MISVGPGSETSTHILEPYQHSILYRLRPYLFISLLALAACLPVSSMLFSLKNDVLAIEFPVQHFISEAIRNGENPVWFNSWCMGFPLQSVLTWSVFSTPRTLLATLFPSDLVVLHIEFLLYVMSSGWVMFALLRKHFGTERTLALLLSCCYMLSGFTVGSSQWLLYITGLTFIPLLIGSTLSLLRRPSAWTATGFAVSCYLLLTNVHIYLTVFTAYFLFFWLLFRLLQALFKNPAAHPPPPRLVPFLLLAFLLTVLLCAAPAYYTYELVEWLERSSPLKADSVFFRSNYLHPAALQSLLLPLGTVRAAYFNTEGSVLDLYMGLLPLLLLVPSLLLNARNRNRKSGLLLGLSVFFLVLSMGHLTPLRNWLNILPGLSHFRHPAVLRAFFILAFVIYLGNSFRGTGFSALLSREGGWNRVMKIVAVFLFGLLLSVMLLHLGGTGELWKGSIAESTRGLQYGQMLLINAALQSVLLLLLLYGLWKQKRLLAPVLILDLFINFLLCTPFYMVSSYPVSEVNQLLDYRRGFPVQLSPPSAVAAEFTDGAGNTWRNTNTFQKQVSHAVSMPGPVILAPVGHFLSSKDIERFKGKPLVCLDRQLLAGDSLRTIVQRPGRVEVLADLQEPGLVVLQQGYFPGWKAWLNGRPIHLERKNQPFVAVYLPAGKGQLLFRFVKPAVTGSAMVLHLIVLGFLGLCAFRANKFRSASPS